MEKFNKAVSKTPVAIRDLSVVLVDYVATDEEHPARQEVRYEIQVEYSTGEIVVRQGNLALHITTTQINALKAFLTDLRVQAMEQILP